MADYSDFPFGMFTTLELAVMFKESVKLGDIDFVRALNKEMKRRQIEMNKKKEVNNASGNVVV